MVFKVTDIAVGGETAIELPNRSLNLRSHKSTVPHNKTTTPSAQQSGTSRLSATFFSRLLTDGLAGRGSALIVAFAGWVMGEVFDRSTAGDRNIGVGEFKVVEFSGREPLDLVMFVGFGVDGVAFPARHSPDLNVEVGLRGALKDTYSTGRVDSDPKLLTQLPNQSIDWRLTGIDVATWHVPNVRVPLAVWMAMAEQDGVTSNDRRSNHLMVLGLLRCHGEASHTR